MYAPFDDTFAPKPPVYDYASKQMPTSDNTECNYIVMFFIAGIIILGITDSLR